MADRWFYSHDKVKSGPFSGRQLREIADAGNIVPTDTIWKEGVEKGMLAGKVKNLFPLALNEAAPAVSAQVQSIPEEEENKVEEIKLEQTTTSGSPEPEPLPDNVGLQPLWEAQATAEKQKAPQHVKKGRAVAGKGAIICGQDGVTVKYMKKCIVCSHQSTTFTTVKIVNGAMNSTFFCPKCRRLRNVELSGRVF
jgi:GYF domain 2